MAYYKGTQVKVRSEKQAFPTNLSIIRQYTASFTTTGI
jgi:hypothetical protein